MGVEGDDVKGEVNREERGAQGGAGEVGTRAAPKSGKK